MFADAGCGDIILLEEGKVEAMDDAQGDRHLANCGSESLRYVVPYCYERSCYTSLNESTVA